MKIVAKVTPEARARMHEALDKALDEFDASSAPQPARRKSSAVDSRLFAFVYEVDEYDWGWTPVYDPHDWNSVENIKPPKVGKYRLKLQLPNSPDKEIVAYWNGEHWQSGAMGGVLQIPPRLLALFTSPK